MAQIVTHNIVKDLVMQNNSLDNPAPLCQELLARKMISPDFKDLSFFEHIPVFVYGTLKIGGERADVLKDCPFLGDARTATSNYVVKTYEKMFPIMFGTDQTNRDSAYVYGEVYAVPPKVLLELDQIESNGSMYQREEKFVFLQDQSYSTRQGQARPSIKCWMYLGMPDFWQDWQSLPNCSMVSVSTRNGNQKGYEYPVGADRSFSMSEIWGDEENEAWDEYDDFRSRIPF